jgi:hypothetical protein
MSRSVGVCEDVLGYEIMILKNFSKENQKQSLKEYFNSIEIEDYESEESEGECVAEAYDGIGSFYGKTDLGGELCCMEGKDGQPVFFMNGIQNWSFNVTLLSMFSTGQGDIGDIYFKESLFLDTIMTAMDVHQHSLYAITKNNRLLSITLN